MIQSATLQAFALAACAASQGGQVAPASRRVTAVAGDGSVVVAGLGKLRLQGVDAPSGEAAKPLAARLAALVGEDFEVEIDASPGDASFVGSLRRSGARTSVNAALLADGVAWYRATTKVVGRRAELVAAAAAAKRSGRGVWSRCAKAEGEPPVQRGGVLGLYYREERFDYHAQVDRVKEIGAEWICLLLTGFVDKVDSSEIDLSGERTVHDARLRETIRYARARGLRVSMLPVVLIRDAGDDDWRGTLRPSDPDTFWASYDAYMRRYLDIAREERVELFYMGSELCSLESQTETWTRLIENARGRFAGWLGYSVNWDHYDVPKFWGLVDQVGITAYFELTDDESADFAAIRDGWKRVRNELAGVAKRLERPLVITEIGYASQRGANTAPWNYYLAPKEVDLVEQARCFRAFAEVMSDAPFLHGVYAFDFFEKGGAEDSTYALWGKPAFDVVKSFFARFKR